MQNIANLLYLKLVPDAANLKVGMVVLKVPVLANTISR